ncbi:unnamed protein product (macronuclear) [Paramecium tetraurelia]|uniref:Protein kinase domain-containing protein n=1 Tax=Paramecium tetraurelia TaxID=5888 RepID=A0CEZ2_PARTE|nr:uncharacterized protein GSPATT00037798001 [Paramecium tetraurelia]CAK69359.1 unnamed protein product [Paramecium tetraurelia]|eukprot:XP_001436756.1 hypothetical protein (macronuclear) [Paramecium tetraurelia strain d4-2]
MLQRIQPQIGNNQPIHNTLEEMSIGQDYTNFVVLENSIFKTVFKIEQTKIYECIRIQSAQKYIVYQLNHSVQSVSPQYIQKLNQYKLVNLIHPENIYYQENCIFMTQQQCLNTFQLQNCRQKLNKQLQLFLVTQLCISFNNILYHIFIALQELERRSFPPYILSPNNIYIIEGVLHLSLMHFNFQETGQQTFDSFKKFVNQYFHLDDYCKDNFEKTTDYLLSNIQIDDSGCNSLNYIKKLLQINYLKLEQAGYNSFIYSSSRPPLFQIYPHIKDQIIIKVLRINDDNDEDVNKYRYSQNERELMFNEQLNDNIKFATFCAYIRIQKIPFFFFQKYPLTLQQLFEESSKTTDHPLQKLQYNFAMQLALALKELHRLQILHRDIKPENVFITNLDYHKANLKIADFDRSRKIDQQDCQEQVSEGDYTVFSSTYNYNPPEAFKTQYGYSSDVWQFGLTLFQMANNGVYPPVKEQLVFLDDDYRKINLDFIKNVLQDKQNINQAYINLISRCLEYESDKRITLNKFIYDLGQIRIDMADEDDIVEPYYYHTSEQSTCNFDSSVCWTNFSLKSPNWSLNKLAQSLGDTSILFKDQ